MGITHGQLGGEAYENSVAYSAVREMTSLRRRSLQPSGAALC